MGLITVSGEPGCRIDEVARLTAQRLGFELVTEAKLRTMIAEEFGAVTSIPDKAYPLVVASIVARLATEHHMVLCMPAAELLLPGFPSLLRARITSSEPRRVGSLMLERNLDRPAARELLRQLEAQEKADRKRRFGRAVVKLGAYDLVANADQFDSEDIAAVIDAAVRQRRLVEQGLLSSVGEAQLQFQVRLQLAKHGITSQRNASLKRRTFANTSEEMFANLLDFYRISWEYEPRSFPIQWSKEGRVLEAFTPDFYLPEVDLYVELTTMKQAHVTKKNRKVKLLRTIYPQINIQVFYQKDFRNLIFKYGLTHRPVTV